MVRGESVVCTDGMFGHGARRGAAALVVLAVLLATFLLVAGTPAWAARAEIDAELAAKLAVLSPDEFVRVIVRMQDQPFVSAAMGADTVKFMLQENAARTQRPVLDFLAQHEARGDVKVYNSFWLVNAAFAEIRVGAVEDLAALPGVASIYEEYMFTVDEAARDSVVVQQPAAAPVWDSYATTYAHQVWEMGYKGAGATVAIADSGIDIDHPELAGAMGGEGPFHEGYWAEFDANGNMVPGSVPHDTDYHGTHVASTAVGRSVGEYTVGMAPEATLAGVIVIPYGEGSWAQVMAGLQWVAEQGFDVVNGSFGANTINSDMAVATDNLAAAGVAPVFSSGNWSPLNPTSYPPGTPGNTPSAIAVGGFDLDGTSAWYNFGGIIEYPGYEYPDEFSKMKPNLSAPGIEVFAADAYAGYRLMGGTSAASPHVAGAVALMLSANPDLTVDEIKEALYSSVGGHEEDYGWADFPTKDLDLGWGRLNALRAVRAVLPTGVFTNVSGTVKTGDEFGDYPIAGATVTFSGPVEAVFETDHRGVFAGEVAEGYYTVTATAPGYKAATRELTVISTGQPIEVDFALEPSPHGSVVGTVADAADDAPLAGVTVRSETGESTATDASGTYWLELAEGTHRLTFEKVGYFTEERELAVIPEQTLQADVAMTFGHKTLVGTVRDTDGQGIADVAVRVDGFDEATTDDGGAFAFDLPAGQYSLEFAKTGYVSTMMSATVAHGSATNLDVSLDAFAGRLVGTVTDLDGSPVADAKVSIQELGLTASTGADGRYEMSAVAVGTWRVTVAHNDFWSQSATVDIAFEQTTTQHFSLQSIGGLSPFHNFFDTAEEQAAWRHVHYLGSVPWHFTQSDSISPPFSAWSGDPTLGYSPANQAVGIISPPFTLPDDEPLDLTFHMRGQIWGPFHYFGVYVLDVESGDENVVFTHELGSTLPWTEVTVPMEEFMGRTVTVEFYVETDGLVRTSDVGIFLDDVVVGQVDPQLDAVIAGVVTDENGQPVAGATVTVVELEPGSAVTRMSQTVTDSEGRFELHVRPGGWTLRATKAPDYVIFEEYVYVEPGGTAEPEIVLTINVPPTPVGGLKAEPGDGFVRLVWDANVEDDVAGYNIYRSLDGAHFHRIGAAEEPEFTVEGLQNGRTYFFRVHAVDVYGLEGEGVEIEATPMDIAPTVHLFDVQPRTLSRGGSLLVSAVLGHPLGDGLLHVRLEATRGADTVQTWEFPAQSLGDFETVVETVDASGRPWAPNVYGLTLYATDADGVTGTSNTVNVALLAPLPQALSFLLGNNPFNPNEESQRIEYALPSAGRVTVAVYTLDGRRVTTLLDEHREAGQHATFWDGTDDRGQVVLAGMYIVRVHFTDADGQRTDLTRHSVVVK